MSQPDETSLSHVELVLDCYDYQAAIYARLTAETTEAKLRRWMETFTAPREEQSMNKIPSKTHLHFTGRDTELAALTTQLQEQALVAVIGMGGMGKTTLTLEAIDWVQQQQLFEAIVWTSAKNQKFAEESIQADTPAAIAKNLQQLLAEIINQALPDHRTTRPDQHQTIVQQWLAQTPALIVLDNLESLDDEKAGAMLQQLHAMLGQGTVLITSRHWMRYEAVSQMTLQGLDERNSLDFVRNEAEKRSLSHIVQAKRTELRPLVQACGGQPLAMRLVVGQLSRTGLRKVLAYLEQPSLNTSTYELYRFIYQVSWDMLSYDGREVLVSLSTLPANMPMEFADLEFVSELPLAEFEAALDELIRFSLVEARGGLEREYHLHPLTHQFIKSEITEGW